jgi:hypothetical protein
MAQAVEHLPSPTFEPSTTKKKEKKRKVGKWGVSSFSEGKKSLICVVLKWLSSLIRQREREKTSHRRGVGENGR